MMMLKSTFLYLMFTHVLVFTLCSQVTIDLGEPPVSGVLLQLKNIENINDGEANDSKGLTLPRVEINDLTKLQSGDADELTGNERDNYIGLIVYNTKRTNNPTSKIGEGLYVWTGDAWQALNDFDGDAGTPIVVDVKKEVLSKELHNDPVNYPIGTLGKYTDVRGANGEEVNEYYMARFYATKVKEKVTTTYRDNLGTWTEETEEERIEDGIWMNENMRTKFAPNNTPIPHRKESTGNGYNLARWENPAEGFLDTVPAVEGLLYNWAAATVGDDGLHGRGGETGTNEGVCQDEEFAILDAWQGICPDGWHLPSMHDWQLLKDAMVANPSLYSTEPALTEATIGKAFKHPSTEHTFNDYTVVGGITGGIEHKGTSKEAHEGGFAAYLTVDWTGDPFLYGAEAYYWTSSNSFSCSSSYSFNIIGWASDDELLETGDYREIAVSEGLWVVSVRGGTDADRINEEPEYYDFYIRTCWHSIGRNAPSTIGSIVRLYNPEVVD